MIWKPFFFPVKVCDALELIEDKATTNNLLGVELSLSGLILDGSSEGNLCVKAYNILKADFPHLSPVQMYLHKQIPVGAGLGGGSSDGAAALLLINTYFQLGLSEPQLIEYALKLGSDCPFFIINKPCFATERGQVLEPALLNLSGYYAVLINPGIHVNTGWAFTQITPRQPQESIRQIIAMPIEDWKNKLTNDFEEPVAKMYPIINAIKATLYQSGAVYAAMSGSGSTVYGIFAEPVFKKISLAAFEKNQH